MREVTSPGDRFICCIVRVITERMLNNDLSIISSRNILFRSTNKMHKAIFT